MQERILEGWNAGLNNNQISKKYHIAAHTVGRYLKKLKLKPRNYNKEAIFCEKSWNALIGTLLGDASLTKTSTDKYPVLRWSHGEAQKDYCLYKASLVNTKHSIYIGTNKGGFKPGSTSITYQSRHLKCLQDIYEVTYVDGKKVIPKDFMFKYFNNLSLALLFMDDGCVDGKSIKLNIQGFSKNDQLWLIEFFKSKFNLTFTLNHSRTYTLLRLSQKSVDDFIFLVQEFIIPSMQYKLPSCGRLKIPLNGETPEEDNPVLN